MEKAKSCNDYPLSRNKTIETLIRKKKWSKALNLINAEKGRMIDPKPRTVGGRHVGKVPSILYLALLRKAPEEIIEAILQVEPASSYVPDLYGMLPLHTACACGSSYDTVRTLLKHDSGRTTYKMDKFRRTPLHHLAYYICYPREAERRFQIFTDDILGDTTESPASTLFWKRGKQNKVKIEAEVNEFMPSDNTSDASKMSLSQQQFEDQLKSLHQLVHIGPKAAYCRDNDRQIPSDILHECKASFACDKPGPKWERADIACIIVRDEMTRYYRTAKEKEEKLGADRFGQQYPSTVSISGSAPTAIGTEGSSVQSESVLSDLSKLEVDSLSFDQMMLSVATPASNRASVS